MRVTWMSPRAGIVLRLMPLGPLAVVMRADASWTYVSAGETGRLQNILVQMKLLVGARGFEPRTPCAQGRCATRLRYAPTLSELRGDSIINDRARVTFAILPKGGMPRRVVLRL